MKKYVYIGIAILVISLISSIGLAHHFYDKYRIEKSEKEGIILLNSKSIEQIEHYKNAYGHLVNRNEGLVLENKTVKELIKNGNLAWLKEFEGVKKNIKNLEFAYRVNTHVLDSLSVMLLDTTRFYIVDNKDTVYFKAQDWKFEDKWGKFSVKQVTPTKADFKYSVNVPLSGAFVWEKKHKFLFKNWRYGKKQYSSEIYSENPHVVVDSLINIKVTKKNNN